jgi:hypothetical protein
MKSDCEFIVEGLATDATNFEVASQVEYLCKLVEYSKR